MIKSSGEFTRTPEEKAHHTGRVAAGRGLGFGIVSFERGSRRPLRSPATDDLEACGVAGGARADVSSSRTSKRGPEAKRAASCAATGEAAQP
jgi:hypothetical protein